MTVWLRVREWILCNSCSRYPSSLTRLQLFIGFFFFIVFSFMFLLCYFVSSWGQMWEVLPSNGRSDVIIWDGSGCRSSKALHSSGSQGHVQALWQLKGCYSVTNLRRKAKVDARCSETPKVSSGLAQLSLFDRECRQKRMSLQQLGILHSQRQAAWRPIRGLPETSVAVLRTWLFEHFLHP